MLCMQESLALSAEQKAALLASRRELLARFGELLQERRAMQARLRAFTLPVLVRADVGWRGHQALSGADASRVLTE